MHEKLLGKFKWDDEDSIEDAANLLIWRFEVAWFSLDDICALITISVRQFSGPSSLRRAIIFERFIIGIFQVDSDWLFKDRNATPSISFAAKAGPHPSMLFYYRRELNKWITGSLWNYKSPH